MSKNKHFSDINVKILNENETSLSLEAEPFERGYGVTVGNSLRRILLTSILVLPLHLLKLMVYSMSLQLLME